VIPKRTDTHNNLIIISLPKNCKE